MVYAEDYGRSVGSRDAITEKLLRVQQGYMRKIEVITDRGARDAIASILDESPISNFKFMKFHIHEISNSRTTVFPLNQNNTLCAPPVRCQRAWKSFLCFIRKPFCVLKKPLHNSKFNVTCQGAIHYSKSFPSAPSQLICLDVTFYVLCCQHYVLCGQHNVLSCQHFVLSRQHFVLSCQHFVLSCQHNVENIVVLNQRSGLSWYKMSKRFASFSSSKKMGVTLETINRFQLSLNKIEEGALSAIGWDWMPLMWLLFWPIVYSLRVCLWYSEEAIFKEFWRKEENAKIQLFPLTAICECPLWMVFLNAPTEWVTICIQLHKIDD